MNETSKLKFESSSFVNMPSGPHLYFPALPEEREPGERPSRKGTVIITATPNEDDPKVLGYVTPYSFHIALEEEAFEQIRSELGERELASKPVMFAITADGEQIVGVEIDGHAITRPPARPESGFFGSKPSEAAHSAR